jgi:hypothetical protein
MVPSSAVAEMQPDPHQPVRLGGGEATRPSAEDGGAAGKRRWPNHALADRRNIRRRWLFLIAIVLSAIAADAHVPVLLAPDVAAFVAAEILSRRQRTTAGLQTLRSQRGCALRRTTARATVAEPVVYLCSSTRTNSIWSQPRCAAAATLVV